MYFWLAIVTNAFKEPDGAALMELLMMFDLSTRKAMGAASYSTRLPM
jgi:hypothetical protein